MTIPKTEILVNMEWADVTIVNLDLALLSFLLENISFHVS